jgi:myosin heavy subunit
VHLFRNMEVQVAGAEEGGKRGATVPSAGTRIRQQCQLLVTALMECSPHYVRW